MRSLIKLNNTVASTVKPGRHQHHDQSADRVGPEQFVTVELEVVEDQQALDEALDVVDHPELTATRHRMAPDTSMITQRQK